MHAGLAQ